MSHSSSNFHASSPTSSSSPGGANPPLQVTGQRLHGSRAGSASSSSAQGISPTGIASPPPFFAAGAPASPMMQQQSAPAAVTASQLQLPPSPGGYSSYPLSHPSSPVSRFNAQAPLSLSSNINLLAPAASCAIPSGLTSPGNSRIQQMIRPIASQASRSGGTAGLAGAAAFQHPLHSTAVQASHSLGQQKANAAAAGGAGAGSSIGGSRVGSAGNNSGSASPTAAGGKVSRSYSSNTFPRLGSAAATAGSGSASRSAGSPSNDHLMSSGASPVPLAGGGARDRASPTMLGRSPEPSSAPSLQATGQSLHPRSATATGHRETVGFGAKRGIHVTRTPPQSQKKRSSNGGHHYQRRNSEQAGPVHGHISDASNPDGELQHRLEDMDLGDDGGHSFTPTGAEAASGYSSDASTFSEASAFPSAALVEHTNYTAPYYTQVAADDEEELADVSGGGAGTGHLGSRFPPPSSPMQLRPGGIPPPPLKTPSAPPSRGPGSGPPSIHIGSSTGPPTPLRSYSRAIDSRDCAYPSSSESSAMQSPLMDGLLHSGSILPPHPSSTAASRLGAAAPFSFPMSPIPPIDSVAVFDTSAVGQHGQATQGQGYGQGPLKTLLSASLTPLLSSPTATLSGGLGLTLPSPAPLRLTTVPALNLPSPHALVDATALATSTSSTSAASPRSVNAAAGAGGAFDPTLKYALQLQGLQGLQGGDLTGCSSAFSSARSLAHSTSGASLGAGSEQDAMTDFNASTARSLSGNQSSFYSSHNASNASSSASLHQHLQQQQQAQQAQQEPQQMLLDQHTRLSYHTHMQR